MNTIIRPAKPADNEFILSLVERFSEFELPHWRSREEINSANLTSMQKAVQDPEDGSLILIAEDETEDRLGFIHLQTQTDYFNGQKQGYISDLAVKQGAEGRGIGHLLLDAAETWAQEQGFGLLTLYVFAGNSHARAVYEKYGFSPEVVKYARVVKQKDENP
ncbi:MAG: GNAT family N-acetyltransferase [Anaerolineae bacterium]|nr:GNAT family N-acetyltransferase [Anaerolineae bacterium]